MASDRDRARRFLQESVRWGDWMGALDQSMEPSLRDLVSRLIDLLDAGDLDGLREIVAPDIVIKQPPELPDANTYEGYDGLVEAFLDWPSQWEETRFEPVRIWQTGPNVTIAQNHQTLRASQTGLEFEADFWFAMRWRDGLLDRWTMHVAEADAERAAAEAQASAPSSSAS